MIIKKAGVVLVNKELKKIGLVYREKYGDYTFPKGHMEEGETFEECAVRETAEETKRDCKIIKELSYHDERYISLKNEDCLNRMFVGVDIGHSNNDSWDTHTLVWLDYEEVKEKLTYQNNKDTWDFFKNEIFNILNRK